METLLKFTHLSHTIVGSVGFAGGLVALLTRKGSRYHRLGGIVFFYGILYSAVSVAVLVVENFLPLAILMSMATIYYLVTALMAARTPRPINPLFHYLLMAIPLVLGAFTFVQFVRILPEVSMGTFGRLLFVFAFVLAVRDDIQMARNHAFDKVFYIKRHAAHMILAMSFAVMAVLRVGIKFDLFGLAFTTVVPLAMGLFGAWYVKRNIDKFVSVKSKETVIADPVS